MLFYRLQDKDYKLEEDWQSYYLNCDSLEEAMLLDIKEGWGMEELADELEDEHNDKKIKETWWNLVREGNNPVNAHTGVSCFADKQKLKDYFIREKQLAERVGNRNWYAEDEYNVVEFEGEWSYQDTGMDGEDIADVIKEVRRIEISSFMEEV
ncbi:hypothetical protein AL714_16250 [Clostridium botulinum]|uniref:hypothetical protein n=1 Tax=Clostridium botulinum TaxID=1491 RepID=UPI00099B89E1|nr:hypothetical protein [Clostridium botulinum]MCC5439797.1 hypothetical protein [Clostridium botulinum]NFR57604.1 hypothetical protein [Clostridium botulinum]OPD35907.1 hypothetical protein AL714_16250 [Clostridium botulinum]